MVGGKKSFPPLLGPGLHYHSFDEVRSLCVDGFPHSTTRPEVMAGLVAFVRNVLHSNSIKCELWVDGSFMTKKIDPPDVDLVLCIHSDFYESATDEQIHLLDMFNNREHHYSIKEKYLCDVYWFPEYPSNHVSFGSGLTNRARWLQTFSRCLPGTDKGIISLRVG